MTPRKKQRSHVSIRVLQIAMIGLGLIILGRLFQLQILEYNRYNPRSRQNALRQQIVAPARGLIYDRNGTLLVDNAPIYSLTITPADYDTTKTPLLARLLDMPIDELKKRITKARRYSWQRSSRLVTEINFDTFSTIEENVWRLPGIGHQVESKRHYPVDSLKASQLLGYLREVSEKEYLESDSYNLGDKIGGSGLEKTYDDRLRGKTGVQYTLTNAMGQSLGPYDNGASDEAPVKGQDLYTTLDAQLQLLAEDLMKGKRGAAVAIDPRDGGILAMVSAPQYDIRKLSGRIDKKYWQAINIDPDKPLFDRAISSRQPPGSTIKPLMGLIGLKLGLITPETKVYNPGYFYLGRRYNDHADPGTYDLVKAIENSSNTYFFSLMDKIAEKGLLNRYHELAADFGLGAKTNIDLPYENKGILPDSAYFDRVIGKHRWGLGDVINLGIGQGFISATPLQMALVTAEIGSGGYRIKPHVVHAIKKSNGQILLDQTPKTKIKWVDADEIQVVKKGMRKAVTEGTGRYYANLDSVKVAGKTGTAQNPHGRDHGWFVAFAPYQHPKIAVAVLVENGGFGSLSAEPVASLLIQKYLTGNINSYVYNVVKTFKPRDE